MVRIGEEIGRKREREAGRLQHKPHPPEGHRGHNYYCYCEVTRHLVLAREALHLWLHLAAVNHIAVEGHPFCWLQLLLITRARFLAPSHGFRLCDLLVFDFPDVPRLPRFAESEGNSFADLPAMLAQLLNFLILRFASSWDALHHSYPFK